MGAWRGVAFGSLGVAPVRRFFRKQRHLEFLPMKVLEQIQDNWVILCAF